MVWFHTLMIFLEVNGTPLKNAALQDILIQSEFLTDGSDKQAITGSMYNHSVRMYKLMYEALNRMLITEMEKMWHLPIVFTMCYR